MGNLPEESNTPAAGAEARAWEYISLEERKERFRRLVAWMGPSGSSSDPVQINADLLALSLDGLVRQVYADECALRLRIGAPSREREAGIESHQRECRSEASAATRKFREQVTKVVRSCQHTVLRDLLKGTLGWWRGALLDKDLRNCDWFARLAADQLALSLVGHTLSAKQPLPDWFHPVAQRAVRNVIIPKRMREALSRNSDDGEAAPRPLLSRRVPDGRVRDYVAAIIECADRYDHRGNGQAIKYFTEACRIFDREWGKRQSGQVASEAVSHELIEDTASVATMPIEQPRERLCRLLASDDGLLWPVLLRCLSGKRAARMWLLFRLRLGYPGEWKLVAEYIPSHECWQQHEDELPEGVAWDDVMASFSPPPISWQAIKRDFARKLQGLSACAAKCG